MFAPATFNYQFCFYFLLFFYFVIPSSPFTLPVFFNSPLNALYPFLPHHILSAFHTWLTSFTVHPDWCVLKPTSSSDLSIHLRYYLLVSVNPNWPPARHWHQAYAVTIQPGWLSWMKLSWAVMWFNLAVVYVVKCFF